MVEDASKEIFGTTQINKKVNLLAVSKGWPAEHIMREAYEHGQLDFGENYINELIHKAKNMPFKCYWHFIGTLQGNKINDLVRLVPNLSSVESLTSERHAKLLSDSVLLNRPNHLLPVLIQVNVSEETSKSGLPCQINLVSPFIKFINETCPGLLFAGLMTIGTSGSQKEFVEMKNLFEEISKLADDSNIKILKKIKGFEQGLRLSMGMSGDFCDAIRHGSTSVRVGSLIFGVRK